ncbi:hypothetical protein BaRGS_00023284 [Batillaria attramentaria]|uniref:SPRY domain-containing protein n=1 Tax=Batillaria attramentaria TaxID=370345 RepID=A0ABD0KED9_9CAEN
MAEFLHAANIKLQDRGTTVIVSASTGGQLKANLVQYRKQALRPERRYYRVTVVDIDTVQYIMTGINFYCWPNRPEWNIKNSIRYHSNEGGIFNGGPGCRSFVPYKKGDTVTCRVSYFGRWRSVVDYLTNNQCVYRQWLYLPPTEVYSTVGFAGTTATVKVEWPTAPAKDIDLFVFTYYEVQVLTFNKPESEGLGIGVVPPVFSRTEFPGWSTDTVGFHGDDGGLHHNGSQVTSSDENKCKQGDVMGCGIVFPPSDVTGGNASLLEPILVTVYFTKNEKLVYQKTVRQPSDDSVKITAPLAPKISTSQMEADLTTLDQKADVKRSSDLNVAEDKGLTSTVHTQSGNLGFVQLTAHALTHEGQSFTVKTENIPTGATCKVLVGVCEEMTSSDDVPAWLCSYSLTSGHITMPAVTNITRKSVSKGTEVRCMVDYIWETEVLVMFLVGEQCIGRAAFKRKTPDTPVYATVAVQGQGVKVTVDWTRVLFPAMFHDENPALKKWLSGEEVTLEGNGKTVIHGKATSIQAPYCFKESLPYIEVDVTQPNLPTIGVGTATSDLQGLIGGRPGELTFDPMTGDIIFDNEFLEIDSPPQVKNVTSLGVGILFTQQDFRQPQSVIVYFTSNSYPFHKTVFTSRPGGVFPTVTFPTNASTATTTPTKADERMGRAATSGKDEESEIGFDNPLVSLESNQLDNLLLDTSVLRFAKKDRNEWKIKSMSAEQMRTLLLAMNSAMPDTVEEYMSETQDWQSQEGEELQGKGKQPSKQTTSNTIAARGNRRRQSRSSNTSAACRLM